MNEEKTSDALTPLMCFNIIKAFLCATSDTFNVDLEGIVLEAKSRGEVIVSKSVASAIEDLEAYLKAQKADS